MSIYSLFKFLHILFAILAVGCSASYLPWMWRSARDPMQLPYILQTVRWLDSRFTNPAFVGLFVTGLFMVLLGGTPLTTPWLAAALVLFILVAAVGGAVYAPAFRRLRLSAERAETPASEIGRLVRQALLMNAAVGLIVLIIVGLMVFKPT